eukprot:5895993-Pleurochrysis_carterae.AAC.1
MTWHFAHRDASRFAPTSCSSRAATPATASAYTFSPRSPCVGCLLIASVPSLRSVYEAAFIFLSMLALRLVTK